MEGLEPSAWLPHIRWHPTRQRNDKGCVNTYVFREGLHHTLVCRTYRCRLRCLGTETTFPFWIPVFPRRVSTPLEACAQACITSPTCVGFKTEVLERHAGGKEFFAEQWSREVDLLVDNSL